MDRMKLVYLVGVIFFIIALGCYLLVTGPTGYDRLESTLHSIPAWLSSREWF